MHYDFHYTTDHQNSKNLHEPFLIFFTKKNPKISIQNNSSVCELFCRNCFCFAENVFVSALIESRSRLQGITMATQLIAEFISKTEQF